MLDLSADNCIHRVLVPIPILTAPIDHSTVGTFNNIPEHTYINANIQLSLCEYTKVIHLYLSAEGYVGLCDFRSLS